MAAARKTAATKPTVDVDTEVEVADEAADNSSPAVYTSSNVAKDRKVLFTIDDVEYSVPTKPGMNITLSFLEEMRTSGNEMFAAMALMKKMLGADSYTALLEWDDLEDEQFSSIMEQCISLAMNRVEEAAGK